MPIRMSGLSSGMDTESLVTALVQGYTTQKDNLVKAQTKAEWKVDSWKDMNKNIYSFYSGKLSAARMSKTYSLKTATVSDDTKAKVSASTSAVAGSQTLEIKRLAATGYLTGGVIEGANGTVKGSTKLGDLAGMTGISDGKLSVTVDSKSTDITVSEEMSVSDFIVKLKDAGLNASFDEVNQRFFISSKTSGAAHDFTLTASNEGGMNALKSMGLFTVNETDVDKYKELAKLHDDVDAREAYIDSEYDKVKVKAEDRAKTYADKYNAAKAIVDTIEQDGTWNPNTNDATIAESKAKFADKYKDYVKKDDSGVAVTDKDGNLVYDTDKLKADNKLTEFEAEKKKLDANVANYEKYKANKEIVDKLSSTGFVQVVDGKAIDAPTDTNVLTNIRAEVDAENQTMRESIAKSVEEKVAFAAKMVSDIGNGTVAADSSTAVRITGKDAQILLNGAVFENNTNNFNINGLTIQATGLTNGTQLVINTETDIDAVYDNIKGFMDEYNKLIKSMEEAYNATGAKGYEPLTDEEKEAMSDDAVEKWEKKIKDSLLRKDATLGNTISAMKNKMSSVFTINGQKYSLANFGIKTLGYFEAADNEKGIYHIDGDSKDAVTSGNEDKLRAAIANDPETVIEFFSQLSNAVYNDLTERMKSTSMSSAYTLYNDKQMTKDITEYKSKVSDKEDEITKWEDYYYKKFSAMETAMAKLNQTQSSMGGLFG